MFHSGKIKIILIYTTINILTLQGNNDILICGKVRKLFDKNIHNYDYIITYYK